MLAPAREEPVASDGHDLVAAAQRVADEVLAPAAESTDQADAVPASHLRALADAGLFGLFGPIAHGGHAASSPLAREVFEVLAGACGVTFFVWVQHHAPVRLLRSSPNVELSGRLLPQLCAGAVLGGVAFAHLRRPGPPAVAARRAGSGFVLSGEAPWVTSWGLAGMYAVAAQVGDDRVVFVAVPGTESERRRPSAPLRLAAMNASSTVRLRFDELPVEEGDVIVELSLDEWRARDRIATAQPNAAAFGVAAACTRLLDAVDPEVAGRLEDERLACREESYRRADEGRGDDQHVGELVRLRAWSLDVALRSAYALVTATGGRSMELSHPAQRLLREAAFYAIQAQTVPLRKATLERVTRRAPSGPPAVPPPPST